MSDPAIKTFLTKSPWHFEGCFFTPDGKTVNVVLRSSTFAEDPGIEPQTLDKVVIHKNKKPESNEVSYVMVIPESEVIPFIKEWGMSIGDEGFWAYTKNLNEWIARVENIRATVGSFQTRRIIEGNRPKNQPAH